MEERPREDGNTPDGVTSAVRSRVSADGNQHSGIKVSWQHRFPSSVRTTYLPRHT